MKKLFYIISITLLFCSCEKVELNLLDENIENRITSMVGKKITSVSNTFKSEGFQKMKIDNQINFIKGKETYILVEDKNIVVSAGYQLNDSTKSFKLYDEYRNDFMLKQTDGYEAYIYADNFVDFGNSYVDSVDIGNNNYIYFYDDPILFYPVLQTNQFFLNVASESWYNGNINKGEIWNLQLGEKAKTILISYSDFSITQ